MVSLAELGSGYAYSVRNSTFFMNNSLKFSLLWSNFIVNQFYATQPNLITEYDSLLVYRIPHTDFSLWGRASYLQQPIYSGGNLGSGRVSFNWTF